MTTITPDERTGWRRVASGVSHGVNINSRVLLALLDDADERCQLEGAVERVRAIHRPGDLMAWAEECEDPEGHHWIDDPHGGGMLCADEIGGTYCMGCAPDGETDMSDYPYPCPTRRAVDEAAS